MDYEQDYRKMGANEPHWYMGLSNDSRQQHCAGISADSDESRMPESSDIPAPLDCEDFN